jgi:hypothetical protein
VMIAEGDGGEVHGGVGGGNSVRPGAAEVRARGHQGASQDDTLPSYPGAYGDPCTRFEMFCTVCSLPLLTSGCAETVRF